ncbi:MAG: camphor resistance protein CrcB [endosymbiont of Galathealinum brachiosum]|uniref:Camphor resistance protein CrcB n=1 Tax=endosymbiont of Galathealinum brachiosum TaxID=2200906 RepID=A0A370DNN0_9GAMM|nr:MAG: camphor resistance protein CrcB [endosymbiont of Galathealinum brachiosum]
MITKKSNFNVSTTINRLENILNKKGIKIVAKIDHTTAAASVDMELRPTQLIIFGNPKIGTPLMQHNQLTGLELPMKVLAWEDKDGDTWVGYHQTKNIINNLGIQYIPEITNKISSALDNLTDYAIRD